VFVGEAPGRLGADRTQIPFFGDQTGKNFERLLKVSGFTRDEIFITNAVLCNPRDDKGNNATPKNEEIQKCSLYLSLVIDIIKPKIIVTLGQSALNALDAIKSHSFILKESVAKPVNWADYTVIPMYHPGPRALIHRNFTAQIGDFQVLNDILDSSKPEKQSDNEKRLPLFDPFEPTLSQKIIYNFVYKLGMISKFKIAKLLYLLDWQEFESTGNIMTGYYYIFQQNGPLATGLTKSLDEMEGHELSFRWVTDVPSYIPGRSIRTSMDLPTEINNKVETILKKYGDHSDKDIKISAYLTKPVKAILRRKNNGESVLNQPVFIISKPWNQ
jgi:uracil-DNA glycosylase family 4